MRPLSIDEHDIAQIFDDQDIDPSRSGRLDLEGFLTAFMQVADCGGQRDRRLLVRCGQQSGRLGTGGPISGALSDQSLPIRRLSIHTTK